jgi:hypothetical protein
VNKIMNYLSSEKEKVRFLTDFHCFFLTATEKSDSIMPSFSRCLAGVGDLC